VESDFQNDLNPFSQAVKVPVKEIKAVVPARADEAV
jgi:hypothetical protein